MVQGTIMLVHLLAGLLLIPQSFSISKSDFTLHTERIKDENLSYLFYQTDACSTQHGREEGDPNWYTTNSAFPHDPSSTGFMATHGTPRFLAMHEMVAVLFGEAKHGLWRFQENGFIRVYRGKGTNGIPLTDKERVLDLRERAVVKTETKKEDESINRLLDILEHNYKAINGDVLNEFEYTFGKEVYEPGGKEWLNWIDLPIYHAKFGDKYKDHVAIDLPLYFCQLSSENFPHMGVTWNLLKAQRLANQVGPLGIRAGLDIRENFNDVVRFNQLPGAGLWANIGQGNSESDMPPKTLEEMKERAQTVNYQRIDFTKVEVEVYLIERAYHNSKDTYLMSAIIMDDKINKEEHSYIRPHGLYYEYLVEKGHTFLNTEPNHFPEIPVETESEAKKVYGIATYGHQHMSRIKRNLTGGGCPAKGGDISTYPWGDVGAGFPTNYEEIVPICDAILIDLKFWANMDGDWTKDDWSLGNSGVSHFGKYEIPYQVQANLYGKYTDPYNVEKKAINPYEVDFTVNHEIQKDPGEDDSAVPVVEFRVNFGKVGIVDEAVLPPLDPRPRACLEKIEAADKKEDIEQEEALLKGSGSGVEGSSQESTVQILLVCVVVEAILLVALVAWVVSDKIKRNRSRPVLPQPGGDIELPVVIENVESQA